MDDQEWTLTWDDEDIVEDFSEILRKEKNLLSSRKVLSVMEDYKRKKRNTKRHCGISPKMVTGTELEVSDSVIPELADDFSDFLYWREPIAALDLDDAVMNSESNCVNDNLKEKPMVSKIEQNFDKTSMAQNPSNTRGKSKPNKRKSEPNKKQHLEVSDSVIPEPADNFSDVLYWREPIAALDLDDPVMNSEYNCVNDKLREKSIASKVEQNFEETIIKQNPSSTRGKSKPNKRKSKTNKKQSSPRLISTTPSEILPSEKSSAAIDSDTAELQILKCGNFSSKTLRNQYGTYPAWMPKRKIQRKARKTRNKSMY